MLEFELKAMLNLVEYTFLMTHYFEHGTVIVQTNYYYDTDFFELNEQGITCRIRERGGECMATIKDHQPGGCNIETSKLVQNSHDASFFHGLGIHHQGSLLTVRTVATPSNSICAMLDENRYLGTVDYELEYEYTPQYEENLKKEIFMLSLKLVQHGIINDPKEFQNRFNIGKSKSSRFFDRKKILQCKNMI